MTERSRKTMGKILDDVDDPLARWIMWMSHATGKSATCAKRKAILAQGTLRFRDDPIYRNDERYLKLWMAYADLTDDASNVFRSLESTGICTELALFWAAWAYVLEMADSYSAAVDILAEGVARGALPSALLEEYRQSFEDRMHERMRTASSSRSTMNLVVDTFQQSHGANSNKRTAAGSIAHATTDIMGSEQQGEASKNQAGRECLNTGKGPHQRHNKKIRNESRSSGKQVGSRALYSKGRNRMHLGSKLAKANDTRDTHNQRECTSTCIPLQARDDNIPAPTSPQQTEHGVVSRGKNCKRCVVASESSILTFSLVQDPFDVAQRRCMTTDTTEYGRWVRSCEVVHDVRNESVSTIWSGTKGKINHGPRQQVLARRRLGNKTVEVLGLLGKGSFAGVFSCRAIGSQEAMAVKLEREENAPTLPWECFITLQLHDRLRFSHERDDSRHQVSGQVVKPDGLFFYRDGCAMTMPQGSSGTLHDLVSAYAKHSQSVPQLVAMHYAIEMLRFCRGMHAVSILHMDIKPDNWLLISPSGATQANTEDQALRSKAHSLSLIDFGGAIDLSIFPRNGSRIEFSGRCCASSFACPAIMEGLTWKHNADLFALGSCIFFMLHGTYLKVCLDTKTQQAAVLGGSRRRWRPVKQCRRYWEVHLWDNLFDKLLNANHREADMAETGAMLARLEESMLSYIGGGPYRSEQLRELLRRQDNMLNYR